MSITNTKDKDLIQFLKRTVVYITLLFVLLATLTSLQNKNYIKDLGVKPVVENSTNADMYVKRVYSKTPFEHALSFYGEKELKGASANNNIILSFFDGLGFQSDNDEVPWCSAFMNYTHIATGYDYTGSVSARSWHKYGDETTTPTAGDIAVFWRESISSWKGHVAYFIRYNNTKSKVLVFGGNQNNEASLKWYPSDRILSFRESCITTMSSYNSTGNYILNSTYDKYITKDSIPISVN